MIQVKASLAVGLIVSMLLSVPVFGDALMEVEGPLAVDPARNRPTLMRVEQIYRLDGIVPVEHPGSLEVTCPESRFGATAVIGPGLTLPLTWEIVQRARRFRSGLGRLVVPADGWLITCADGRQRRLYGKVVAEDGTLTTELLIGGIRGRFLSRIGIRRRRMPDPPDRVRLRLAWSPADLAPAIGGSEITLRNAEPR